MNTSIPYKQRILEYLEKVGAQGANNAQIQKETGIPSYQQVYILTQKLAREKEITAWKERGKWIFVLADSPSPASFHGEWLVISSPDFDQAYLEMMTIPHIKIRVDKYTFAGAFEIGLINGDFTGRLDGKHVLFSFEAIDEMEPMHGAGTISLQNGQMIFRLLCYSADEWTFICKRSTSK